MEEPKLWYEFSRINANLFLIFGVFGIEPPWFTSKPKILKMLWYIYHNITDLVLYIVVLGHLIGSAFLTNPFAILTNTVVLIHGSMIVAETVTLRFYKPRLQSYLKVLNEVMLDISNNPVGDHEVLKQIHKSHFDLSQRLTKFTILMFFTGGSIFLLPESIKSLVYPEDAHIVIPGWYPYDTNVTINKQITNMFHVVGWEYGNLKVGTIGNAWQSFITMHICQFRQLQYSFGKIFPSDNVGIGNFGPKDQRETEVRFKLWLRQHQKVLEATKKLQSVLSLILFFAYLECLLNICMVAFLTTVKSEWTPLQRYAANGVVGSVFVHMFILCRLGDLLQEASTTVTTRGYGSNLYRLPSKIQKSVILIIKRSQIPVRFSGVKLFCINSLYFKALVQAVFSYYMALRQFQAHN